MRDSDASGPEPTEEWWSRFFSGVALRCWRQAIPPQVTRAQVQAIRRILRLEAGDRVLDVPCGAGRHALELAAAGIAVTGVDLSSELLAEARAAAAGRKLEATFERRDMRDLPWPGRFDGAYCLGNSFGYLAGRGNEDFIDAVARTLRRGAGFVMETGAAAESVLPGLGADEEHRAGDVILRSSSSYDPRRGTLAVTYTFITDGDEAGAESRAAIYRVFTARQICEMLRDAGFAEVEIHGDPAGADYAVGDPVLYVRARKA